PAFDRTTARPPVFLSSGPTSRSQPFHLPAATAISPVVEPSPDTGTNQYEPSVGRLVRKTVLDLPVASHVRYRRRRLSLELNRIRRPLGVSSKPHKLSSDSAQRTRPFT